MRNIASVSLSVKKKKMSDVMKGKQMMRTLCGIILAGMIVNSGAVMAEDVIVSEAVHVQVYVQFVTVAKAEWESLLRAEPGGMPDKDAILELLKAGKAKVHSAQSMTTLSGRQATVKAVEEYVYPTSLSVEPPLASSTNTADFGASPFVVVSPDNFQMREVGIILSCTPEAREDGFINVTLAPQLIGEPTWKTYKAICVTADGKERDVVLEQPFFYSLGVASSLMIRDGETVIAGGGLDGNKAEATCVLVTARLVDASGHSQRRKLNATTEGEK